jgi:hypothetical protein
LSKNLLLNGHVCRRRKDYWRTCPGVYRGVWRRNLCERALGVLKALFQRVCRLRARVWRGPPLGSSRDGRSLSLSVRCLLADVSGVYERADFLCRPYCVSCPEFQFHMCIAPYPPIQISTFRRGPRHPGPRLMPSWPPCPLVVLEVSAAPALGANSFMGVVY